MTRDAPLHEHRARAGDDRGVVLACGVAALLGFLTTDISSSVSGDRVAALAAGGLLTMLANSLVPSAYERTRSLAGVATAVRFCLSLLGS